MGRFFITQRSGYNYSFAKYRNVTLEVRKDTPEYIELEVQFEPNKHFKTIGMLAQQILITNVKEIQNYISDINVIRRRR